MSFWHKHRWVTVAVHPMYAVTPAMPWVHSPITEVLLRCQCGDVRTKCLDGHWNQAQLSDSGTVDSKAIAKELGVKL